MNRIIFFPSIFLSEDVVSDRWRLLVWMLRDQLGFKIVTTGTEIPKNVEIAIIIGLPRHILPGNPRFNGKTKTIVYTADIHKIANHKEKTRQVLERCTVHLSAGDKIFKDNWPEFLDKHVYFPYFFASQDRYESLEFNENPTMKCLLTGHIAKAYKLRRGVYCFAISKLPGAEIFEILKHPGNLSAKEKGAIVGADYANLLNKYFCGITSTLYEYPLAKHFEIMASGSLLFSDETEDLTRLGMISGKHYISVTADNYREKVKECLESPREYENIRKNGMEFSRKYHGINSRFKTIEKIVNRLERQG